MLIHAIVPASRANGPDLRAVVFFQGCTLGCPGCWNPTSHPFSGREMKAEDVASDVMRTRADQSIQGVTFSGGEPMQQATALRALVRILRSQAPEMSFGMFIGYTEGELAEGRYWIRGQSLSPIHKRHLWEEIQAQLDFAVLGRFNRLQPISAPLRTSRNQVLRLFSRRYVPSDCSEQSVEVTIHDGGRAEVTGFPTLGAPC
jgi:anaerobic ribonucleoside-triphosphate reductase activating protein